MIIDGVTYIDPTAWVDPRAEIGQGAKIWNWTKVRESVRIGRDCSIGQCAYIDVGVVLGHDCRIQNSVQIYKGVTIGNQVYVGPNVTFSNDKYPRAYNSNWTLVETTVEDGASIGAGAVIVCGVRLGAFCMVGAGSVVTADVPRFGLVVGQPARLVDYVNIRGVPVAHDMTRPAPDEAWLRAG